MVLQITDVIGKMPYRMQFPGGWIDQPFVSQHNPSPPGSMVVVALEPTCRFMDRCGMGTSTRRVAMTLWNGVLPDRDPAELVRELYATENAGRPEPAEGIDSDNPQQSGEHEEDGERRQGCGPDPRRSGRQTTPSTHERGVGFLRIGHNASADKSRRDRPPSSG